MQCINHGQPAGMRENGIAWAQNILPKLALGPVKELLHAA